MQLKVCSYSIHDDAPRFFRNITGKGFWLIEIWTTNNVERIEVEIRNRTKSKFSDLREFISKELIEAIADLSPITDGGFTAYFVKN